jgi:hypothetical protein
VAAGFQFDLQGIMTHAGIASLAALKGHEILIASSAHQSIWPWLKERYGYTDDQIGPYTGSLQPFFADPTVAMQGYSTDEPFEAQQAHVPVNFFLLAKYGFPPYGSSIITTRAFAASAALRRRVDGRVAELSPRPRTRERAHPDRQPEINRPSERFLRGGAQTERCRHRR